MCFAISASRATQCLVRQFVDPVGEIRYSLPTAGGTTHVICVGAQNALSSGNSRARPNCGN